VGLGNALRAAARTQDASALIQALQGARAGASPLVAEHIEWALGQGGEAGT
jgi:epoxyqueuosine reductase